ncbi:MAG TPA: uroporphyrinogen-III synthase [Steroidobacteraceae bacterium]|jgi:uroporphyrinogen-III synthase|nr:uroporphyrinogen-III synthase [Steroidobacteraceae bacterium]
MNASGSAFAPVVVTRAEASDGPLSSQLRTLGLEVLLWPAVSVAPASGHSLERALSRIAEFDWIVFASRNAVTAVIRWLPRLPDRVRVAAIGRATAQVLKSRGFRVDLMPNEAHAAALVDAFAAQGCAGARILYPASSRALPTITQGLTQLGAEVRQVEAYRTEAAPLDANDCRAWIDRAVIGAVTFASPSAVIELERALGTSHFARLLSQAKVIAMGPTTARALAARGKTAVLAESATLSGLANTTLRLLQERT